MFYHDHLQTQDALRQEQLDGFLQAYAVEKARIEARRQGHSVTETELRDGSIRLQIQIGGAA